MQGYSRWVSFGLDVKLYFDSYFYDLIGKRNEAAPIRKWLRANGHQVMASTEANVVEAMRITDLTERDQRLLTIKRVGISIHPAYDYRRYREIADELWRLRPDWFRHSLDRQRIVEYLRRRKRDWLVVSNPTRVTDLQEKNLHIDALIGRDIGRQKQHRRRPQLGVGWSPRHSNAQVQECMDRRTQPDVHLRYASSEESRATIDGEIRPNGHLAWLIGLMWPQSRDDWDRFWMCDLDVARTPLCRIVGLTEYYQRQRKVTPGNSIDRLGHAPHLYEFDYFLTTDRRFFQVLQDVRAEMSDVTLAQVALIDSEAPSALAAIESAIN